MALGSPALGYEWTKHSAHPAIACMKGSICAAPRAQLRPTKGQRKMCSGELRPTIYILCMYIYDAYIHIYIYIYTHMVYSDGLHEGEHLRGPQCAVEAYEGQRRMCSGELRPTIYIICMYIYDAYVHIYKYTYIHMCIQRWPA